MSTAKLIVAFAALALLATTVTAAAIQRQCVDNITNGVEAVINAVEDIAKAVVDCPMGDLAQCKADAYASSNQFAAAARSFRLAGMLKLSGDVSGIVSEILGMLSAWESNNGFSIFGDALHLIHYVSNSVRDVPAAAKRCGVNVFQEDHGHGK